MIDPQIFHPILCSMKTAPAYKSACVYEKTNIVYQLMLLTMSTVGYAIFRWYIERDKKTTKKTKKPDGLCRYVLCHEAGRWLLLDLQVVAALFSRQSSKIRYTKILKTGRRNTIFQYFKDNRKSMLSLGILAKLRRRPICIEFKQPLGYPMVVSQKLQFQPRKKRLNGGADCCKCGAPNKQTGGQTWISPRGGTLSKVMITH